MKRRKREGRTTPNTFIPKPFECATCYRPHDPSEYKLRPCNRLSLSLLLRKKMSSKTLEGGVQWTQEVVQQKSKITKICITICIHVTKITKKIKSTLTTDNTKITGPTANQTNFKFNIIIFIYKLSMHSPVSSCSTPPFLQNPCAVLNQ